MPRHRERPRWLAAFLEKQRVPPGSRLSLWLHGESVMRHYGGEHPAQGATESSEKGPGVTSSARARSERYYSAVHPARSQQPTPLQSYLNFSRPLTTDGLSNAQESYVHPAFASPFTLKPPPRAVTKSRHRKAKHTATGRTCIDATNRRIRYKSIGTFVSGVVLTIVLTVYLALATANIVPTTAFHVTFIFCILVLTMIFAHFLVRLCMLSMRAQPDYARRKPILHCHRQRQRHRRHRPHDLEAGSRRRECLTDQPEAPDRPQNADSRATGKDVPAPPPAYGWWRGSVRVDPEDVRYYDPDQEDLHQRTRSLVFAGSGHRPPSYTSDPLDVGVERPAPLFNAQRVLVRENAVRDV